MSEGEVGKELEGIQRHKVGKDGSNREDKPLEVVWGGGGNRIGCHLLEMGLVINTKESFIHSLSSFYLTSFLYMFVLFLFLFNLYHPCSDKLSLCIHDTVADDRVHVCAFVDMDML